MERKIAKVQRQCQRPNASKISPPARLKTHNEQSTTPAAEKSESNSLPAGSVCGRVRKKFASRNMQTQVRTTATAAKSDLVTFQISIPTKGHRNKMPIPAQICWQSKLAASSACFCLFFLFQ